MVKEDGYTSSGVRGVQLTTGDVIFVVAGIHKSGKTDLLELADAVGSTGAFTGSGEGGQQHGSQNRDDSDYHQRCVQRKTLNT